MAKYNAAFINNIAEEGNKIEAIEYLQRTWDDLQNLRIALAKRGYTVREINRAQDSGTFDGQVRQS